MFVRTVLVVASLALAGCASSDDGPPSTTTTRAPEVTTSAPLIDLDDGGLEISDLAPGEEPVGPYYDGIYSLAVGDCFNLRRVTSSTGIVDFVLKIPCDLGHQNEMYADASYPADSNARYPGEDVVRAWALQYCYEAFETFVGVPYERSTLEIGFDSPTQEYFEDPSRSYRGVRCWVSSEGEDLVVNSAAGTKR